METETLYEILRAKHEIDKWTRRLSQVLKKKGAVRYQRSPKTTIEGYAISVSEPTITIVCDRPDGTKINVVASLTAIAKGNGFEDEIELLKWLANEGVNRD